MTFEEKLAAQGRRMDELKAKLDDAVKASEEARRKSREEIAAEIEKLNDAFDEFDAAVDAQVDKQVETLAAQVEKQYDTLDAQIEKQGETLAAQVEKQYDTLDRQVEKQGATMERRVDMLAAQVEKQYDTLDRQVDKQIRDANAAAELAGEKIGQDVAKVKAAFTLDKATAEALANEPTGVDLIERGTADQAACAAGDIAAVKEDIRLMRESGERKREAAELRAQMRLNSAKKKIADHKEAVDRAEQEEWILDLLDYAERCYETAYSYALEAEYTLMEAAYELDYYNGRFCPKE